MEISAMRYTDMTIYNATRDMPGGPIVVEETNGFDSSIEPYSDDAGSPTLGGWIGYLIGYAMLAAGLLYCMYGL